MSDVLAPAWSALERGRLGECTRLLASARGVDRARADCLAGLLSCVSGRHARAVAELTAALPRLDAHWSANALVGRGTAFAYLLRFAAADADFVEAAQRFRAAGRHDRAAACVHNRGFVALQAGDVPLALLLFGQAALDPRRFPEALVDRAQALIAAGLAADARPLLARASTLLDARGTALAEALLAVAHCALRTGQPELAADTAARAADLFRRQGRTSWQAAARAAELIAHGGRTSVVRQVAELCDRHGWAVPAAELRLARGDRPMWTDVAKGRHARHPQRQLLGWLARAKLAPDRRAVLAACRAGLDRARRENIANDHVVALAELGLRAAVDSGRARTILRWADRLADRSGAPPVDAELAARLTVLRSAAASGSAGRVRRLERQVRALDVASRGRHVTAEWTFAELFDALGTARLVRYFPRDGRLRAVSCVDDRFDEGDVVVVPAPTMWAALPRWPGRAVTVAPSVGAWLRARRADVPGEGRVWLAGTGLRYAAREARTLHQRHGGELRVGRAATAAAALALMNGADLVHIAAHGRFREDQPLFSCVELSGGPLFGHDVQRLARPPRRVVLAACDAGRAATVRPGGEALGMAMAFLRAGTATVIASVRTVPDRETVNLVTALHEGLAAGLPPARALANAQAEHGHLGFICLGAG